MNLGDLVIRKSYGGDVTFRVDNILQNRAVIKGTEFRLLADSPLEDLVQVPPTRVTERGARAQIKATESLTWLRKDRQVQSQRSGESVSGSTGTWGPSPKEAAYFEVPGKVLHLDGDALYLKKSLSLYEQPAHTGGGTSCQRIQNGGDAVSSAAPCASRYRSDYRP